MDFWTFILTRAYMLFRNSLLSQCLVRSPRKMAEIIWDENIDEAPMETMCSDPLYGSIFSIS